MNRCVVLVGAIISITAGCDSRSEQEKLQGQWRLHEMHGEFDFDLGSSSKAEGPFITFTDDKFTVEYGQGAKPTRRKVTGTFTCDETKNPKQVTFKFNGRSVVAIYQFQGGQLRVCVGEDDKVPPTEFTGGAPRFTTSRPALLIFDRVKKK